MKTVFALIYIVFLTSCTSVSITDRKQLMILGDDVIYPEAFRAYKDFKSKTKLIESGKEIDQINKVTSNLKTAIKNYWHIGPQRARVEIPQVSTQKHEYVRNPNPSSPKS